MLNWFYILAEMIYLKLILLINVSTDQVDIQQFMLCQSFCGNFFYENANKFWVSFVIW